MTTSILDVLTTLDPAAEDSQRAKSAKSSKSGKRGQIGKKGDAQPDDTRHFAAQGHFPVSDLSVAVDGLGALETALSPQRAQALQQRSEPSRFGLREQTLLDPAVRHSGEIAADAVQLSWAGNAFQNLLREVAAALGVGQFEGRLHNLLVYGPGQFFKPHQDTEKHPRMVATLVLIWPSAHIGGELRVRLDKQEECFKSQQLSASDQIRWCAFYADCRHEVLPVEEGWRVALAFDLMLPEVAAEPATGSATHAAEPANPLLLAAMRQTLGLDSAQPALTPWVFLLDHEYSEHGLRWHLLKGQDRVRVAALRAAAEELGLTIHLALAEVHESWTAQPEGDWRSPRGRYSRGGRSRDDDDEDEDDDDDRYDSDLDVEPDELIEEEMSLNFWVDAQGHVSSRTSLSLAPDDAESFTKTSRAYLVDEEYEGYMGNYGETLDYWYRRAAVVIESPQATHRIRFQADFDAALADIRDRAKAPGHSAALAADVAAVADLIKSQVSFKGRKLLAAVADIALGLSDTQAGAALLAGFNLANFEPADAKVLARLERSRGTPWMLELMKAWTDPAAPRSGGMGSRWSDGSYWGGSVDPAQALPRPWPRPLVAFVEACIKAGWSDALLKTAMHACGLALVKRHADLAKTSPVNRLALHEELLAIVCELASALRVVEPGGGELLQTLLALVSDQPRLYPLDTLAPLLACAAPADCAQALRERVIGALRELLAEPKRAPEDHALHGIEWQCHCADCKPAVKWAESRTGDPLTLAMAEARREHVQSKLTVAGAPLTFETVRRGSPYKLVLTKPKDLQAREQVVRERRERALATLLA